MASSSRPLPPSMPSDTISTQAYTLASTHLPLPILHHSIRVYKYAQHIAQHQSSTWSQESEKLPLLFTACILHDIGSCPLYNQTPQRFEVESADFAAAHLREFSVSEPDIHEVWTAIALHTSPQIAERISDLARMVREAVLIDFGKRKLLDEVFGGDEVKRDKFVGDIESEWPRLEVEKVLGDCVVKQAKDRPEKAPPASWPGVLLRSALEEPGWEGVNRAF